MASREKMWNSTQELTELKKKCLQNAISSLTLEWNDLHNHLDSTQHYFQQRFTELESRENRLLSIQVSITESNKNLNSIRQSLDEKAKQIEQLQVERMNELKLKENQLDLVRKSAEERIKEAELREEKLDAQQKLIEGFFEKVGVEIKQFENIQKSVGEKLEEINLREMKLDSRERLLELAQNFYEGCRKEFQSEKLVLKSDQVLSKELEAKQKQSIERFAEKEMIGTPSLHQENPYEAQNKVPKKNRSQFTSLNRNLQLPKPDSSDGLICPFCKVSHQYSEDMWMTSLRCKNCVLPFTANDFYDQGAPPGSNWGHPGGKGLTAGSNRAQPAFPRKKQDPNQETSKVVVAAKLMEPGSSSNTSRKRDQEASREMALLEELDGFPLVNIDEELALLGELDGLPFGKRKFALDSIDKEMALLNELDGFTFWQTEIY